MTHSDSESDLMVFLRARLDEDERIARAGSESGGPHWPNSDSETRTPQLEHARRHDPARVLAEVDAKRQIIERHSVRDNAPACAECGGFKSTTSQVYGIVHDGYLIPWPCRTLRLLALPYADHPDYQDEWKP